MSKSEVFGIRCEIDRHIDIAVRPRVAAGHRTEHPDGGDASVAQCWLQRAQASEDVGALRRLAFGFFQEALDQAADQILDPFASLGRDGFHAVADVFGNPDGEERGVGHCRAIRFRTCADVHR